MKRSATPAAPPRARPRVWHMRWGRTVRAAVFTLAGFAVLLVAARLALPSFLRDYVNGVIDRSPDYDGQVGEIDVHLWRGAYSIRDIEIVKTTRRVPVPFFESPLVEFSIDWKALSQGSARGQMTIERPKLNFVHGPSGEDTQTGAAQPWLAIIDDLYPFQIDRADVKDGEIHFRAFHTSPEVDVFLQHVDATLENLTNVENSTDPLIATLTAKGEAMGGAPFELDMSLDPNSHRPTFSMAARLLDVEVTRLNALARAYGDFDFEEGRFDFAMEATAKNGQLEGYAKPLFRNVRVISLRDIKNDDPLQVLWESLVGIVGFVFKNQPRDQFGTRITLSGDMDSPDMNLMEVVGNVLRNAFVRAYLPRLDARVAPEEAARQDGLDMEEGGEDEGGDEGDVQ